MRLIPVWVVLAGCATDYRAELDALPSVDVVHGPDAVAIAAPSLGISPESIDSIAWVVGEMRQPSGEPIAGVALGCDLWISWWGASNTSGASKDGPAISYTAFAHEIAHCALWLRGEDDPGHTRAEWWGPGGRVSQANADLVAAGL